MKSNIKKIITVSSALSVIVILVWLLLTIFGVRAFILRSASMEPMYPQGSLVLVNTQIRPEDVSVGDVLVYQADTKQYVMHRYVDTNTFQGDQNQTQEHVDLATHLVGREALIVPPVSYIFEHFIKRLMP